MRSCFALCVLLAVASASIADPPAYRLRDRQMEYHGPERENGPGGAAEAVEIAWFGPDDAEHSEAGDFWIAAQLAVEVANAAGGLQGKPFRLQPVWSDSPWGEGARKLAELVYAGRVVAIVGGIDGDSTHVAEQIAAKARLPVISPVATDKSLNLAGVAWIFSCLPGDHLLTPVLAGAIAARDANARLVLLSSIDHDSRLFAGELHAAFRKREIGLAQRVDFDPKAAVPHKLVGEAMQAEAEAVVVVADPAMSARLVVALREAGFQGNVYAGPGAARYRFLEIAGKAAEGVVVPLPSALPKRPTVKARSFAADFEKRCGHPPDYAAAQTYDAVSMLVEAIREAGANRVRIADSLRALSPYEGVAGVVRWDKVGANTRAVCVGVYRDGRLVGEK